jgi:hypothetical protein
MTNSIAVWDVPMPVIAGETFPIKAGAKPTTGRSLANSRIEVSDAAGAVVASGHLGATPWPGSEALYWAALVVPAPANSQVAEYTVRLILQGDHAEDAVASRFTVTSAAKPEHKLGVKITEKQSAEPLGGVEIRIGPFRARTDDGGRAELHVCKGEYQIHLWRTAHIAPVAPVRVEGDASIELTMVHVPEEHPDARWVR